MAEFLTRWQNKYKTERPNIDLLKFLPDISKYSSYPIYVLIYWVDLLAMLATLAPLYSIRQAVILNYNFMSGVLTGLCLYISGR